MKVLIVHNRYRKAIPSGENSVVDAEIAILHTSGVDVATYLRSSDEIAEMSGAQKVAVALGPIRSGQGVREFTELLDSERPD
ncbi:MAG: glycosyl transferase family 1, partial [Actinobacteria bacterium]|nr:glycosyl transferase family 1 [Actinomycetota bacterium]